jgi:hypothetical protein
LLTCQPVHRLKMPLRSRVRPEEPGAPGEAERSGRGCPARKRARSGRRRLGRTIPSGLIAETASSRIPLAGNGACRDASAACVRRVEGPGHVLGDELVPLEVVAEAFRRLRPVRRRLSWREAFGLTVPGLSARGAADAPAGGRCSRPGRRKKCGQRQTAGRSGAREALICQQRPGGVGRARRRCIGC